MIDIKTVIAEIGRKNGIILGREDPVLTVHTMLEMHKEELGEIQREIHSQGYANFIQAMELEYIKWSDESHKRAEQVLSVAMLEAKKITDQHVNTIKASLAAEVSEAMDKKIVEMMCVQNGQRWLAIANMFTAAFLAIAAMFFAIIVKW